MSAGNSTADPPQSKPAAATDNWARPAKPYPEFPVTARPTGRWCQKIRGRIHYFVLWDDTDAALAEYLNHKNPCTRAASRARTPKPSLSKT
jgi:hypothetical protein